MDIQRSSEPRYNFLHTHWFFSIVRKNSPSVWDMLLRREFHFNRTSAETRCKIIANWNFWTEAFWVNLSMGVTKRGWLSHHEISEYCFKLWPLIPDESERRVLGFDVSLYENYRYCIQFEFSWHAFSKLYRQKEFFSYTITIKSYAKLNEGICAFLIADKSLVKFQKRSEST